jgi:hypothetical protein
VTLPRLLDSERKLLYDNQGCLKCHRVFVNHRSNNCPNKFPDATVYKTLTQAFVDMISQCVNKKSAAAVLPQGDDDNVQPIAVVMGSSSNPVAYMPLTRQM